VISRAVLLTFTLGALGCAPALSSFSGSRTTPEGRGDVAIGASARAPLGDLARPADPTQPQQAVIGLTSPGGIAPAGFFRLGLSRRVDLGVLIVGTTGRLELRLSHRLSTVARVIGGVSGYGGYVVRDDDPEGRGEAFRAGALVPIVLALDMGSIFEAWGGIRLGYEHVGGTVHPDPALAMSGQADAFRGGLVVGLAVGLARLHALVELAADYEYWRGQLAGNGFERQGVALVPGFAIRARF
jgi:hypothetical protein